MIESLIFGIISPSIVVLCYCLGLLIKHCIKKIDNKFIPLIVAGFGVILACIMIKGISVDAVATGIISGWASTGVHQTIKNLKGGNANG